MIELAPNRFLVETGGELPNLRNAKRLYLDGETTSGDDAVSGLRPFHGHRFCGVAVTADDCPKIWYVPVRHRIRGGPRYPGCVAEATFREWLRDLLTTCDEWSNHGVKFDARFAAVDGAEFSCKLVDTLTAAKLYDSDRMFRGGYGLKALAKDLLGHDIDDLKESVQAWLGNVKLARGKHANDYGLVPPDVMGRYACEDVASARELRLFLDANMPDDVKPLWETEIALTPVLFDMEREGMRVDLGELRQQDLALRVKLLMLEERIHEAVGKTMNPVSTDDCYELLVNHYGLPVLSRDPETNNPSFDKDALKSYLQHPDVTSDDKRRGVVDMLLKYRHDHTILSLFITPYQELQSNGVLHPDYNQSVRSGRLSCGDPNMQQLSKEAKLLIHPPPNEAFLSNDYSQVEFRLIVHYIRDVDAIRAYMEDPDTDFHKWVAQLCGIPRRPAKNVNFAIGYGAGQRKVTEMLAGDMDLMGQFSALIDQAVADGRVHQSRRKEAFDLLCKQRAQEVYNTYHDRLPGIRTTSRRAAYRARSRGWVHNAYGRRLHLPARAAHLAFNRIIQSCAADITKERLVALSPRYNERTRELGLRLCACVHDEVLLVGDRDVTRDPATIRHVVETLEDTRFEFRIPIRASAGWSDANWATASGDDGAIARAHYCQPCG